MTRILPDEVVQLIKATFKYDKDTGVVTWKIATKGYGGKIFPGREAGTLKDGYVQIGFLGECWRAHHIAWIIMTGDLFSPDKEVDHKNRVRHDNRWENLRLVNRSGNNFNSLPKSDNKSGMKGVSWDNTNNRWHARITVNGKVTTLGNFRHFEDACKARRKAEQEYVGQFAAEYEVTPNEHNSRVGTAADKSANLKQAWADPELRSEQSKRIAAYLATPEGKAQRQKQAREVNSRPEVRAKHSANTSNLTWITNGEKSSRIPQDQPIPAGWVRGKGKWITNGVESRCISPNSAIPDGWQYGRTL